MTQRVEHLAEGVTLYLGDCLDRLTEIEPNSIDSCVTDPPYGLGFMGKAWDHGVPGLPYWKLIFRVLKPGAHLLSFGGTRTYHRMACAIEDAGFEIRDQIQWLYGSGFPKSHDVSKGIDRAAGAEREVIGEDRYAARQWSGFGTALKPACEPVVLARKPLSEPTIAANVLKWGTGALNIDGCRVESDGGHFRSTVNGRRGGMNEGDEREGAALGMFEPGKSFEPTNSALGRWPANVIHDGSEEVVGVFPESDHARGNTSETNGGGGMYGHPKIRMEPNAGDNGSAARFFYTAKADADDRLGSKHPTVKPLDLIQYLVRLITPPKGLVLDPFAGTGTLGEACIREGMRAILIERETEYQEDIRRRMKFAMAGPAERSREAIKARTKDKPIDAGPLFEQPKPAKQDVLDL